MDHRYDQSGLFKRQSRSQPKHRLVPDRALHEAGRHHTTAAHVCGRALVRLATVHSAIREASGPTREGGRGKSSNDWYVRGASTENVKRQKLTIAKCSSFFFKKPAPTGISTFPLHDSLPT